MDGVNVLGIMTFIGGVILAIYGFLYTPGWVTEVAGIAIACITLPLLILFNT